MKTPVICLLIIALYVCCGLANAGYISSFFNWKRVATNAFRNRHAARFVPELSAVLDVDAWLPEAMSEAYAHMLDNILTQGAVAASPSGRNPSEFPNYWYYWVRDGALTMDTCRIKWDQLPHGDPEKLILEKMLWQYAEHEAQIQQVPTQTGLGEPKFQIDGTAFNEPWGRPQNDGAALRASVLIRFAKKILKNGGDARRVETLLYDGRYPSNSVIKRDLEYVASHVSQPSFDLWEECLGSHFFTKAVQWRALDEGAEFARLMNDGLAADYYERIADVLRRDIESHLDRNSGVIRETLNRVGGIDWKTSNLDISAILAVVYTFSEIESRKPSLLKQDIFSSHMDTLAEKFRLLYQINRNNYGGLVAPGIGRYTEDRYSGKDGDNMGNPWFLATNGAAEFYYLRGEILCREFATFENSTASQEMRIIKGESNIASQLRDESQRKEKDERTDIGLLAEDLKGKGDTYLRRSALHQGPSYTMAEQFNRITGFQQSARDLTWSYASLLRAGWARGRLEACLNSLGSRY